MAICLQFSLQVYGALRRLGCRFLTYEDGLLDICIWYITCYLKKKLMEPIVTRMLYIFFFRFVLVMCRDASVIFN